jgi:hypothetical protein
LPPASFGKIEDLALRDRPKVPFRVARLALAMGLSRTDAVEEQDERGPASLPRNERAARRDPRRPRDRHLTSAPVATPFDIPSRPTSWSGHDIRTVQEFLGDREVSTTMIYTHVLRHGARGVRSPLDPA